MRTGYDLAWLAAQRAPRHPALVDDRTERRYTYEELMAEVDALAAGLAAQGIGNASRVATALPNAIEHCLLLLALQRLGAVPALMNFRLPPSELARLMQQGEVAAAFVRDDAGTLAALRAALGSRIPLHTDILGLRGDAARLPGRPRPAPDDTAFIFYTSGTTGLPKGAVIPHRTTANRLTFLSTEGGLLHGGHTRALGMVPLSHAIGFYCVFLAALAYGGTYYALSAFNPVAALDLIERHRINYLFAVPTLYGALLSAPSYRPERVKSLELVMHGGAPIQPELLERLAREWPARIRHIYGSTEIMSPLSFRDPVGQPTRLRTNYASHTRVVQPGGGPEAQVAPGEAGELIVEVDPDIAFQGYLNRADATAEKLRGGWYYTGDVCILRADGDYELVGRLDDVVRSGGESIYPEEVEAVLAMHASVREACVIGVPDARWGEMVIACVVLAPGVADCRALDAHFTSSALARFKRPRAYLRLEALPRNAANKVLRKPLREAAMKAREARDANFFEL